MRIEFWGVRGAFPTPDADKMRYGGNTNSVVITSPELPDHYIMLDAGTGLARFGAMFNYTTDKCDATLLLSHLHLQHIIGFQFTPFGFNPNIQTWVIGPSHRDMPMEAIFDNIMEPHYSPVYGIANLLAKVRFEEVDSQLRQVGPIMILAMPFEHTFDTNSWGYRLQDKTGSVIYLTDTNLREEDGSLTQRAIRLAYEADVLIIGADDPYHQRDREGTTTYADAVELTRLSKVKHLVLYHHHPDATDDELDTLQASLRQDNPDLKITIAAERMVIEL